MKKKLSLRAESIRTLSSEALRAAGGGSVYTNLTITLVTRVQPSLACVVSLSCAGPCLSAHC